jgi:hypothetical protein
MSNKALSIQLGAKQAELDASLKHLSLMKAKVAALEKQTKASATTLKAAFARIGFRMSDDPSAEELEAGRAYLDGYRTRQNQIVDQMVSSLGFTPESKRAELEKSFSSTFEPS